MVGEQTNLVPGFMEFGPVIEAGNIFKALNIVPDPGDSIHHGSYYYY